MSYQDADKVRRLVVGNAAAKSVLRCLADCCNSETGQCNPSIDTISRETELNRKTVYKAIAYLEEKGFVRRERIVLNSSNNYVLNIDSDSRDTKNGTCPKNGSTKIGSTKNGTSPKNGLSAGPNMGRVVGPNLGHESVNESVKESVNNIFVRRAETGSPDAQKNDAVEDQFNLTETTDKKELTPQQRTQQIADHCPQQKIIDLYHECLPSLPPVRLWMSARRQQALAARWREVVKGKGYQSESEGLNFFRSFFNFIGRSPFLMGQVPQKDGRSWRCDLEWIVQLKNFEKICDRRYHDK